MATPSTGSKNSEATPAKDILEAADSDFGENIGSTTESKKGKTTNQL